MYRQGSYWYEKRIIERELRERERERERARENELWVEIERDRTFSLSDKAKGTMFCRKRNKYKPLDYL